jgi:L-ascorbate metabolism protein UlaG (beta-lactamase superfamily)
LVALIVVVALPGCETCDPLKNAKLREAVGRPVDQRSALRVTFLGNTTLVVRDAATTLVVDGFLSRPGRFRTLLGGVGPSEKIIIDELSAVGVQTVDAVVVGHAHHDHALDATAISDIFTAKAIGSASFGNLYKGSHRPENKNTFVPIPPEGGIEPVGEFKVRFIPSAHVAPESFIQRIVAGEIKKPLARPAHFSRLKCGDIFALHISHPHGDIVVTTTAGALPKRLKGLTPEGQPPPVLFLAVGYLSKEPPARRDEYWQNTVEEVLPDVIVPVHWDDLTKKLSDGLQVPPLIMGNTAVAMHFVKDRAGDRKVRIMDKRETLYIHKRKVYIPDPGHVLR